MTDPTTTVLTAEEIAAAYAVWAKQQAKGEAYRGSFDSFRDMDLLKPGRLLATIAAKDQRIAALDTHYRACAGLEAANFDLVHRNEALESKLREVEADRTALLGMNAPWPLRDVLTTLADFARKELRDNSRDFHGHEAVSTCIQRAVNIVEGIDWNHATAYQDAKEK
jgi:hypothetical protein